MNITGFVRLACWIYAAFMLLTVGSESPGFNWRMNCGDLVTGGAVYGLLDSDYDGTSILVWNLSSGKWTTVLEVNEPFEDVELSPTCRWIAFRGYDRNLERRFVRVFSRDGGEQHELPNAQCYAWGRLGEADVIAYILGSDTEITGLHSEGTWLLNLETGEQWQIHPRGHEVAWASFDGHFYVKDLDSESEKFSEVQRYNQNLRAMEDTTFRGIDFSPDGTYYHTRAYGEGEFQVYLRETGEDISKRYQKVFSICYNGNPNFWLGNSRLVFRSNKVNERKNRIADLAQNEALEADCEVVGFADSEEGKIITLVKGGVLARPFEEVMKVIYAEVEPEPPSGK